MGQRDIVREFGKDISQAFDILYWESGGDLDSEEGRREFSRTHFWERRNIEREYIRRERPMGVEVLPLDDAMQLPDQRADSEDALVEKMAATSFLNLLNPIIQGLPEIYREAVMALQEKDGEQKDAIDLMSRELGIKPATAKRRIQRAMEMLRERACRVGLRLG